jgi:hypothetical protein
LQNYSYFNIVGVKRIPVILSPEDELGLIKSTRHLSDVLKMLNQFPSYKMNAYPVSEMVNQQDVNDVILLNPTGEKLQSEIQPSLNMRHHHYHKDKPYSDRLWFENR